MIEKYRALLAKYYAAEDETAIELVKELQIAEERLKFLSALETAGVDNWTGYDDAILILKGSS